MGQFLALSWLIGLGVQEVLQKFYWNFQEFAFRFFMGASGFRLEMSVNSCVDEHAEFTGSLGQLWCLHSVTSPSVKGAS